MGAIIGTTAGGTGLPAGFAELPEKIYAGDPLWVPEDVDALKAAFGPENPWFATTGEAAAFCVPGHVRAAGFAPKNLRIDGVAAAYFGYWESATSADEGVTEADRAVMGAVETWARERGAEKLFGPVNFTTAGMYRWRMAVEPNAVPVVDEPTNRPHYPAQATALGFSEALRYLTSVSRFPHDYLAVKRPELVAAEAMGYSFAPIDVDLWMAKLGELHPMINAAFAENPGFVPLDEAGFLRVCGESLARKLCPQTSIMAFASTGEVAGFFLVYPHYGPLIVAGRGPDRVLVKALNYAEHWPMLRDCEPVTAIIKTVAVRPEHRRHGIMNAMFVASFDRAATTDYTQWFGAMIRADNPSRRLGTGSTIAERWYALFAKPLG